MTSLESLINLSEKYFGQTVPEPKALKGDGSDRELYRFQTKNNSWIGVTNSNYKENAAFIFLSEHLAKCNIPVPAVYATNPEEGVYLLEDLGEMTLADILSEWNSSDPVNSTAIINAYQKVLDWLPQIQFTANKGLDYSFCYREKELNEGAYQKAICYFRDYFWNIFAKNYTLSSALNAELDMLSKKVGDIEKDVMVHLDFQSRNVMWKDNAPYFIDYQTACKGALYYDPAALLYASKAGLDNEMRTTLINYYIQILQEWRKISADEFLYNFYHFVLIRRLRSLGTYGFLSSQKGKYYFLNSISSTIKEVYFLLTNMTALKPWHELTGIFKQWINDPNLSQISYLKSQI